MQLTLIQSPKPTPAISQKDEEEARHYEQHSYWSERYKRALSHTDSAQTNDDITTDWHFAWSDLKPLFKNKQLKFLRTQKVLDIGCGLSEILQQLIEDDFKGQMSGIDYVGEIINHRNNLNSSKQVTFEHADALNLTSFPFSFFGLIIDKATTDGLSCTDESVQKTPQMYKQISRLLVPGGVYLLTTVQELESSWCTDLLLPSLVEGSDGYKFKVDCHTVEAENEEDEYPNVFIIQKSERKVSKRRSQPISTSKPTLDDESDDWRSKVIIKQHFH